MGTIIRRGLVHENIAFDVVRYGSMHAYRLHGRKRIIESLAKYYTEPEAIDAAKDRIEDLVGGQPTLV